VAQRGDIAARLVRTWRRRGMRTVAVYSDSDAGTLHVAEADTAVRIGPPPPAESYLNKSAILDAAATCNTQAIHPGYGFLAENEDFAERDAAAGLVRVVPPAAAMPALGDKAHAKAPAERHGVAFV